VYLMIAAELEVDAGVLLGPDEVQRELSSGEAVLLRVLREAAIDPGEAIARLAGLGVGRGEGRGEPPPGGL